MRTISERSSQSRGYWKTFSLIAFLLMTNRGRAQEDADMGTMPDGQVPGASARTEIKLDSFAIAKNMGEVSARFDKALRVQGYEGQGWSYLGKDPSETITKSTSAAPLKKDALIYGFTVVTQVEQYDIHTGEWVRGSKRFQVRNTADVTTISDHIRLILHNAPVGHYRMFLFAVDFGETRPERQSNPTTFVKWDQYFHHTYKKPMLSELATIPLRHRTLEGLCFVYEFERAPADGELMFNNTPHLSAEQHLKGSGLMQSLNLN